MTDNLSLLTDDPIDTPPTDPIPVPPKRGRGRPPKSAAGTASKPPTAPKADRPPTAPKESTAGPGRPSRKTKRQEGIAGFYVIGGGLAMMGSVHVGSTIITNADAVGAAMAEWAETSPKVAKAIDQFLTSGGAAAVIAAHVPIILAMVTVIRKGEPKAAALDPSALEGLGDLGGLVGMLGGLLNGAG